MAYKIRHKGKPKEPFLVHGLTAPLVEVLLIIAILITAVVLPKPAEKTDWVAVVAGAAGAAGAVLAGATRLLQALLGDLARRPAVSAAMTFLYRACLVLIVSGLAAAFYRTLFR
jgi:uncharacterized membrane protein